MQKQLTNVSPLSVQHLQLIENRIANERKSVALAYVLWFFLGLWGIHNFYLARPKLAVFQLCGGVFSILLLMASGGNGAGLIGGLVLIVWGLTFFVDLFLIPGRAKDYSERLRRQYTAELQYASALAGTS